MLIFWPYCHNRDYFVLYLHRQTLKFTNMVQKSKDILRVERSTSNALKRIEKLMEKNLTFHRTNLAELREKYNLIEFV